MVANGASLSAVWRELRRLIGTKPLAHIRSIDILDGATCRASLPSKAPVVILLAVRFGNVLLIDQRVAHPKESTVFAQAPVRRITPPDRSP